MSKNVELIKKKMLDMLYEFIIINTILKGNGLKDCTRTQYPCYNKKQIAKKVRHGFVRFS